jgi:hypothetical protein
MVDREADFAVQYSACRDFAAGRQRLAKPYAAYFIGNWSNTPGNG